MESPEESSTKKQKKHKDKSERKESKKRKRDAKDSSEPPNGEQQHNVTSTNQIPHPTPSTEDDRTTKKQKQNNKDQANSQTPAVKSESNASTTAPQVPQQSPFSKEKENKKKHKDSQQEEPHQLPRPSQQDTGPPVADADASLSLQATDKVKKKKKRDKHKDKPSETANEELPIDSQNPKSLIQQASSKVSNTNATESPFFVQTTCFYLPLSAIAQEKPLEGLCAEHFSPMLLTFAEPFNGILLSYSNPRFEEPLPKHIIRQLHKAQRKAARSGKGTSQKIFAALPSSSSNQNGNVGTDPNATDSKALAKAIDEYGVTYVWVAADFLILQPQLNTWIEGHVSVQSPSQLGIVCWNLVNASIERKQLPEGWKWIGGDKQKKAKDMKDSDKDTNRGKTKPGSFEGYYVDAGGRKVEGMLRFRVLQVDSLQAFGKDRNFMSIEGSLLTKEGNEKQAEK